MNTDIIEAAAAEAVEESSNLITRLPLRQRKLLRYMALVDEHEAARAVGYDESYVRRLRSAPGPFREAYQSLFKDPIEHYRQDLLHLLPHALNTYQGILEDPQIDPKTRLSAAKDILQAAGLHKQTVRVEEVARAKDHDVKVYVRLLVMGRISEDEVPEHLKDKVLPQVIEGESRVLEP